MKSNCRWGKGLHLVPSLVLIEALIPVLIVTAKPRGGMQGNDNAHAEISPPILKGKDPVIMLGSAVAVSQETVIESESSSADLMLLKVEKVVSGKEPGQYVRADFSHHSSAKIDPEKARLQRELLVPLRQGKTMKIHLRPPIEGAECRWTIPPPPKPREEVGFMTPVMLPVGNAKGYPDINGLPCYAFELQDIEEIVSPDKTK
jgi:hypothetical protein